MAQPEECEKTHSNADLLSKLDSDDRHTPKVDVGVCYIVSYFQKDKNTKCIWKKKSIVRMHKYRDRNMCRS